MEQTRGQWRSTAGFVLAAAGSAIGLGNIWRFPYVVGTNGGAGFILVYLACVFLICTPYLLAELALGRRTQRNPLGAIRAIRGPSRWDVVGVLAILGSFCILSYYSAIAGWAFGYVFKSVLAPAMPAAEFLASPGLSIPAFAVFMALTVAVVAGGVEKGIERWARLLMPALLVLMVLLIVRGLTLDGASDGVKFLFRPEFSEIRGTTVVSALGQAFYSLSLGMGAMVTYGSYLPRSTDLFRAGASVAMFDTGIAMLAGLMIFPALFALGKDPASGPTLIFEVLPALFREMPLGTPVAVAFFGLITIAALTSTVSLLETAVAWLVDERRWTRRRSVLVIGAAAFLLGLPALLSQGAVTGLTEMSAFGVTSFLYVMDFLWGNAALAVVAILFSVFVGRVWGIEGATREIASGSSVPRWACDSWIWFLRWPFPAFVFLVLLELFGVL